MTRVLHSPVETSERIVNPLTAAGEARLYRAMRYFWHPVLWSSELTDRPKRVVLLGEQLVVARLGSKVVCFPDLCVHRGTALSLGRIEDEQLRCAYHGWTYGADGRCTSIPARHGTNIPTRARLLPHLVAERYGMIWVCLEKEPYFPLPEFPHMDDPRFRFVEVPAYQWKCSAARRIENYVDFSHFAWVHPGILGDPDHPEVADHEVWREGGELRFGYTGFEGKTAVDPDEVSEHADVLTYRLFLPFTVLLDHHMKSVDKHYILFFSVSPVAPDAAKGFTYMGRDCSFDEKTDQEMLEFNDLVIEQDRRVVESQRPEELPYDLSAELHIKGVDQVSLDYRRWLVAIADELVPP
jgi:phenylpropionate dioxygenase-like ring-hydroxylating dioxygenase large terminal subunit